VTIRPAIALFAYGEEGFAALDELLWQGARPVVLFTHEETPGERVWYRSVRQLAERNGIPVKTDADLGDETIPLLRDLQVELILLSGYRKDIPNKIFEAPRLGSYEIHLSLLPKYKGSNSVNRAVINGETETGATLSAIGGGIAGQQTVKIEKDDTALEVLCKAVLAVRNVLAMHIMEMEEGYPSLIASDTSESVSLSPIEPRDGLIDWSMGSDEICNLIRGLTHPFCGAYTEMDGRKLYIWEARAAGGKAEAGEVISHEPPAFGTASGIIEALRWQFEGEPERGRTR
jgi:methionyl-tRNA formyltransferase